MMRELMGEWPQVVKFVGLSLAAMMVATAAASIVFGRPLMAVASAVVAGWSLSLCMDVWRAEVVRDLKGRERGWDERG